MPNEKLIAPEWSTDQWLNTREHHKLSDFRGKVVMLHAFQMLCPGCVSHALPQAQRAWDTFNHDDLMVIGLHTVFEHHDAMMPNALKAFVHEYRLSFPIAVDQNQRRRTAHSVIEHRFRSPLFVAGFIDRDGIVRRHRFGRIDDLTLGAELATLIAADRVAEGVVRKNTDGVSTCLDERCTVE